MCGIAGIFNFEKEKPVDASALQKMTDALSHRGPDGEGQFIKQNIGLGHRRLAIIDLDTGNQPMYSNDGNNVIVFNGEIYNYVELRNELKQLGYMFKTKSDTEVILKAYEAWGIECLSRLNGMWAFAIWDERRQQLFLSRDRIGEKPLFFAETNTSFLFASEIKSLLAYGLPDEPNWEVLELYLALSYVPAPYSFYKGINKLKPGHYILVRQGRWEEKKYWDLPSIDETNMISDASYAFESFETLLRDAVRIRMRSDVPFGAFLSGGLDSSSIVAIMSEVSEHPVETFTIGFKEKEFDERQLARAVAQQFRTNHHEEVVIPEVFEESLHNVLVQYDEPFGDSSAIPTGHVSRLARKRVKMVLTGDGGDEVLSGYTSYQGIKLTAQYNMMPKPVRKSVTALLTNMARLSRGNARYRLNRYSRATEVAVLDFRERIIRKMCRIDLEALKRLVGDCRTCIRIEDYIADFLDQCGYKDEFYRLMYFDLKLSLPEDMLVKVDRMSMAHSLETRIPFLDPRLIEFMIEVHKDLKMRGYERKSILRRTIGTRLPDAIMRAPKKGFGVPLREWFKGASFDNALESLSTKEFGLKASVIQDIVEENRAGKKDHGNFIWMLFLLQRWIRREEPSVVS